MDYQYIQFEGLRYEIDVGCMKMQRQDLHIILIPKSYLEHSRSVMSHIIPCAFRHYTTKEVTINYQEHLVQSGKRLQLKKKLL